MGQTKYTCAFTNYSANLYLVHKQKQLSPNTGISLMHLEMNAQEITCYFRTTNHKLCHLDAPSTSRDFEAALKNNFDLPSSSVQNLVPEDLPIWGNATKRSAPCLVSADQVIERACKTGRRHNKSSLNAKCPACITVSSAMTLWLHL